MSTLQEALDKAYSEGYEHGKADALAEKDAEIARLTPLIEACQSLHDEVAEKCAERDELLAALRESIKYWEMLADKGKNVPQALPRWRAAIARVEGGQP